MLNVKRLLKRPIRWSDWFRSLFYETLPIQCLALLWAVAYADSLESRVRQELEPHGDESSEIVAIDRTPPIPGMAHTAAPGDQSQIRQD